MTGPLLKIVRSLSLALALAFFGQLVLLVGAADAQVRTITSLPYTVTSADNGYTLVLTGNRMNSTGSAINFSGAVHDIVLDLNTDTIAWGTTGTVGTTAISFGGTTAIYNITISGGTILHLPPTSMETPAAALNASAMTIGNRHHDITIRKTKFTIRGHDSQFIIHQGGAYNLDIDSCTFQSFRESFTARDQWKLSALNVFLGTVPLTTAGFEYTVKWSNNTFLSANWCNLYIEGPTLKALVYGNSFITDGYNTYTVGTFSSSAQNYSVSMRYGESGTVGGRSIVNCYNNTFRSGTSHSGGRGIFLSSIDGYSLHPDSSIFIHDNDIEVHQGWDEEERTLNAIIVRQGVSNVYIRDNIITCIGNANNPSSSYDVGPMACLRLTGSPMLDGVKIVGNTLTSYFIGGVSPNYGTSGPNGQGIIFDAYEMDMPNVTIDSNTFSTDNVCVRWGFYNGNAGSSVFRNNTYNYRSGDNGYVFYLGGSGGANENSIGNIDRDGTFTGGAAPTDIYTNDGESDPMDIALEVTLRVTVIGSNAQPVSGALVRITNAYGTLVGNVTTDSIGIARQIVRYGYYANAARGADSTAFNLFSVKAKKLTDSTTIPYSVGANTHSAVVTLSQTTGGGTEVDTTSPGRILDLGAACDSLEQGIRLRWTATGDDGAAGQSDWYDIRYSLTNINESNFAAASIVPNPPTPRPSGESETCLVTTLENNAAYYFAIKAFDDAGLGSSLGDATEYSPITIRAPTPDTIIVNQDTRLVTLVANLAPSCEQTFVQFQVDTSDSFPSPIMSVDSTPVPMATAVISGLLDNKLYHWRCRGISTDGLRTSGFTQTQAMVPFVSFVTACDSLELVAPIGGTTASPDNPALSVENASSDPNVYFFELDDGTDFVELVASGSVNQQAGTNTSWTVPTELIDGETYYWRAKVNNCEFAPAASFVAAQGEGFAFPNPFQPSSGQVLTFARVAAESDLIILTVSGDVVRHWSDTDGEDITWDGTNNSGNPVASGVYVWTVEPGDLNGKIIVVR